MQRVMHSRGSVCFKPIIFSIAAAVSLSSTVRAEEAENIEELFSKGKLVLESRYRLETVDQDNFALNAAASTLRTRLNFTTATMNGFSGFLEFTNTTSIGSQKFNSTTNGVTNRPVVADPELTELNQAYLSYKVGGLTLKGGRRAINLDDQRFIGSVDFRQNDQTYDSITGEYASGKFKATYGYVVNIKRIFGRDNPAGEFDTNTHIFNASYKGLSFGTLTGFAYLLDINNPGALGLSTSTIGFRFNGKSKVSDNLSIGYSASYASQSDYKDNPNNYRADYLQGQLTASSAGFTAGVHYELLGSDNSVGFSTPLATLHKFNGWADRFLVTPGTGLSDMSASLAYKVPGNGPLAGMLLKTIYHDFNSDVGDIDYGTEWDFLVTKKINNYLSGSVKAAFFNADSFVNDSTRFWFTLTAKF